MNDIDYVSKSLQDIEQPAILPVVKRAANLWEVRDSSDSDSDDDTMIPFEREEITGPIRSAHEIPLQDIDVGEIPAEIPLQVEIIPVAITQYHSGEFTIARSVDIQNKKNKGISPGSLLSDCNHHPITRVLDLFGPISNPQIILKGRLPLKIDLYAVVSDSEFPDPDQIAKQFPGCDASNRYDEEAPNQDFSDDEEEKEFKERAKNQRKVKVITDDAPSYGYPRS